MPPRHGKMAPMTVVLLGDSHLDYLPPSHQERLATATGREVRNLAVGGSSAVDLPGQARGETLQEASAVVISVGTNDLHPLLGGTAAGFADDLERFLAAHPGSRWVLLSTPGFDLDRFRLDGIDLAARVADYEKAGRAVVEHHRGQVVPARDLLAPLGAAAFVPDGVHLTEDAYDVLVPAMARAIGS